MSSKNLDALTDEELTKYTHKAASDLSYHNAAEGKAYFEEAQQASEALRRYRMGRAAMAERNLKWENKGYLIHDQAIL